MTEQEAIKQIEEHLAIAGCENLMCDVESLEVAINALKKQIPKKPKITRTSALITFGICPNCGTEINCLDNPFYHKDADCLQKLNWGEM